MESAIEVSSKRKLSITFLTMLLLVITASAAHCQTFAEWWSQKKTQRKYLLEQIAALQVYTDYLKKGYEIANSGLSTIKNFKNGEFGLHKAFYTSLKAVSPAIRNNAKAAGVIAFQIAISKAFNNIESNDILSLSNRQYIGDVRDKVMDECGKDLEELILVITSGKVEMTDDERMKRLDKVYRSMQDKSAFTQSFCSDVGLLIRQAIQEQEYIKELRRLYESN